MRSLQKIKAEMLQAVESLQMTLHYFMLNACLTIVSYRITIFLKYIIAVKKM